MESRNTLTMCRLCLCENECFINIFEANEWHGYVAAEVMSDLLRLQVSETDGYPHVVCSACLTKLTDFKVFKEQCQTSKITYDNVFASNESLIQHQPKTVEFVTIKSEPLDSSDGEENVSKEQDDEMSSTTLGRTYRINESSIRKMADKIKEALKQRRLLNDKAGDDPDVTDGEESSEEGHLEESYGDSEMCEDDPLGEDSSEVPVHEIKSESEDIIEESKSDSEDILNELEEHSEPLTSLGNSGNAPSSKYSKVRRRRRLGLEQKLKIIRQLEAGVSPATLGRTYDLNESSIRTIRRMADKIKEALGQGSSDEKLDSSMKEDEEALCNNSLQIQTHFMDTPHRAHSSVRRRKVITLGTKLEIIQKLESGRSAAAVAREYDMNESSVRTIWKMADKIRASVAHTGSLNAKITRMRSALLEKMEKLLTKWLEAQSAAGIQTTPVVVRGKALLIYKRLKMQQGSNSVGEPFMASKGWYDKFCKRQKIQGFKAKRMAKGDSGKVEERRGH